MRIFVIIYTLSLSVNCRWVYEPTQTNNNLEYYVQTQGFFNYSEAEDACKSMVPEASLVSISSPEINNFVVSLVNKSFLAYDTFYIGLTSESTGNTFTWTGSSPLSYSNWACNNTTPTTEQGNCVNVVNVLNFEWSPVPCNFSNQKYICQRKNDICLTTPCLNQATCTQTNDSYTCNCGAAYTGKNCNISAQLSSELNVTLTGSLALNDIGDIKDYTVKVEYETLGCWIDHADRAIPTLESTNYLLINPRYMDRSNALVKCAVSAYLLNYTVFAVENGGWCASSANAINTYKRYGISKVCDPTTGEGGPFALQVYQITNGELIGGCKNQPCKNDATCTNIYNDYSCDCKPGYTSKDCDELIDNCEINPCQNNGTCDSFVNDYNCTCAAGYSGRNCTTIIDNCDSTPCLFGGTCTNEVNNFQCDCTPGYSGKTCATEIDNCAINPCQNNGSCDSFVNDYNCTCAAGYSGKNCSTIIDNCDSTPCLFGGTCTNEVNNFQCDCTPGYSGKTCATEIDNCAINPCQNNGSCDSFVNDYNCTCAAGYSGKNCSTIIDNCDSTPCLFGGTCTNEVNNFQCDCTPGYSGKTCATEIDNCAINPCQNNGSCDSFVNDYNCTCAAGYSGTNCTTIINNCDSTPCLFGGTCTNEVNDFQCDCTPGYSGKTCATVAQRGITNELNITFNKYGQVSELQNEITTTVQVSYVDEGCWTPSLIPSLEKTLYFLMDDYKTRTNAVRKCAAAAYVEGFNVFALTDGGECHSSANAQSTYNQLGRSTNCPNDGKGGNLSNRVYRITGGSRTVIANCTQMECSENSLCTGLLNESNCVCNYGYEGDGIYCIGICTPTTLEHKDEKYSFSKGNENMEVYSNEKCPDGRGIASVFCEKIGNKTSYDEITLYVLPCGSSISDFTNNGSNIPVNDAANAVGVLTSNLTEDSLGDAAGLVNSIGLQLATNSTATIDLKPARSVLTGISYIISSIGDNNTTTEVQAGLAKSAQSILNNIQLPTNITSTEITTPNFNAKVTDISPGTEPGFSYTNYTYVAPPSISTTGVITPPAASVYVPKNVVEMAADSESQSSLRISVLVYSNPALFPSKQNATKTVSIDLSSLRNTMTLNNGIVTTYNNLGVRDGDIVPNISRSGKSIERMLRCGKYNPITQSYDTGVCTRVLNQYPPQCKCSSVGTFSCIVSTVWFPSSFILAQVSTVGCALSLVGIALTLMLYGFVKDLKKRPVAFYVINICVCLLGVYLTFLFGMPATDEKNACSFATAALQFFLLAFWSWSCANAYSVFRMVTKVFSEPGLPQRAIFAVSYVIPFAIVMANVAATIFTTDNRIPYDDINFQSNYRHLSMCWLRLYSFYFGFILPMGLALLFNMYMFLRVVLKLTVHRVQVQSSSQRNLAKDALVAAIVMASMMGLTWLFGFLLLASSDELYSEIFSWIFTIFNATQGVSIFYVNCLRLKATRDLWLKSILCKCCYKNDSHSRFPSSVSSTINKKTKEESL